MQWWVDYCLKAKMPATYSKNRDPKKIGEEKKRSGGPLRRTGAQAVEWDEALGPSLDALPSAQLPQIRTVLQRYRSMRISKPNISVAKLAGELAKEVRVIWNNAAIPIVSDKVCAKRIVEAIELWNSKHNPGERLERTFQDKLDELFDLKPKLPGRKGPKSVKKELGAYKILLRNSGKRTWNASQKESGSDESDWEKDYEFYMDQFEVRAKIWILFTLDGWK